MRGRRNAPRVRAQQAADSVVAVVRREAERRVTKRGSV